MYNFITYQFDVAICLGLLFLVWKIFLQKETFHQLNRGYLLFALLISFVVPLIKISQPDNSQIFNFILNPINIGNDVVSKSTVNNIKLITIITTIYIIISAVFAVILGLKIFKIITLINKGQKKKINNLNVISSNKNISPFAFMNYIFINEKEIDENKLQEILFHESIHLKQKHTFDIILIEIINIIQWFNPFLYLYKHSLKTTHEYLSDEKVIEQGFDLDEYQLLLIKQKIGVQPGFANNFNKSLTLKRITMMNQKKSKIVAKFKIIFAIPVIAMSLLLFSFNNSQVNKTNILPNPTEINDSIAPPKVMPKFPGGQTALRTFIAENVKYPKDALEKGYEDQVFVKFMVNKKGKVSNITIEKGKYKLLNNEAIRVISSLPNFKPATTKGKAVDTYMIIPINFKMSDK